MRKLLIANRGEIACRVLRTARRMGLRTVAVFSDADAQAPHVALADEAVRVGPAPAAQSYLDIGALIAAARATGADAVHPGYGFLSERADFAQACLDAGLVFVGPPPAAIRAMGDKAAAKRRMAEAGVSCVPGYLGEDQGDARLLAEARRLGTPLLVKAVAGGGGRGMRLVHDLAQLPHALAGARREAESAFGDGALMLERLVEDAHHVEVQVFADSHGRVVHLGERDCSAQRRRQKLIEETPSPVVDAALRERMGRDAVAAARAVGYVGAGTVEFIVDARRAHWFLEMNTRLQVEHPVTEAVTGIDLVEWQLRVAAGEPLPLEQHEIRFEGHAIEARLYAEDPYDGFKPQTGRIGAWRAPAGDGIRVDAGIAAGGEVTSHYDALLAKVIAHGRDRGEAIGRLVHALDDTLLAGVRHNARFLRELLLHARFADATLTTATLDAWPETAAAGGRASEHRDPADAGDPRATLLRRPAPPEPLWRIAAALRHGGGWRPASVASFDLTLQCDGATRVLRALPPGVRLLARDGVDAEVEVDGVRCRVAAVDDGDSLHLHADGLTFKFSEPSPWPAAEKVADPARARAPVAGVVAQVLVGPGQQVAAGQPLASVEAMKMELWLHAAAAGTVRAVHAAAKDSVAAGALIVELDVVP